jgi:RNA polymerase sigma factor (sigma-70 family)
MAVAPTSPVSVDPQFDMWARPHIAVMRRVIAARVPALDPDDILQEALARAWRKWATYSPEKGTPRSWLLAIALDQSRRAASRNTRTYLLSDGSSTDHPAAAAAVDIDRNIDLRAAVRALPDRQREAAVLFYYVDLPVNEIAALMGCSAGTVKSTLSDARRRLAALLKEET